MIISNTILLQAQGKIFVDKQDALIYLQGKGLYLNNLDDTSLIRALPRWNYHLTMDYENNLWSNGFDGVKYLGLIKYYNKNAVSYIDLIEKGLSSNYINAITTNNNNIAILVFNKVYESHLNQIDFKEIDTENISSLQDIKYYNDTLLILTSKSLLIYSPTNKNEININKKLEYGKILSTFNSTVFISNLDSLYKINLISNHVKKIETSSQPSFINNFNDYNAAVINSQIFFYSHKGIFVFYNEEFYLIESLKCWDMKSSSDNIFIYDDSGLQTLPINYFKKNGLSISNGSEIFNSKLDLYKGIIIKDNKILTKPKIKEQNIDLFKETELEKINYYRTKLTRELIDENKKFNHYELLTISLITVIILFLNYFIFRRKKFQVLPLVLIPMLIIFSLVLAVYVTSSNLMGLYPSLIWVCSLPLFLIILVNETNEKIMKGEFVKYLHEFSHGSIGLNNLSRINRFLINQHNKSKFQGECEKTLNDLFEQYRKYTYHSFIELNSRIPIKSSLIKNQLKIFFIFYFINILIRIRLSSYPLLRIDNSILKTSSLFIKHFEMIKWHYYALVKTNICQVIDDVINNFGKIIDEKKITVTVQNNDLNNPAVVIPTNVLYKIIDNIIMNSIEAFKDETPANRVIEISIINKLLTLEILISDNAGGVNENLINTLFLPTTSSKKMAVTVFMRRNN
jgi:hypothetical protein